MVTEKQSTQEVKVSLSFSSVSTSKFYIPVNANEFIENLTSRPLHQALDIGDQDYHDEIKKLELDIKGIADKAHTALQAHNTPKKTEPVKSLGEQISSLARPDFYSRLAFLSAAAGTVYALMISSTQLHRTAYALGTIVLGYLALRPLKQSQPESVKLPILDLQVTNIKTWINLKMPTIEQRYKDEDAKINKWVMEDYASADNKKILANRDQLLLVTSYFKELVSKRYY